MKYFQHKPLLHKFSHVDEFLKEFSLTKEDFILASRSILEAVVCAVRSFC